VLKQRVITASILAVVFIVVLFAAPQIVFTLFVTVVVALAAWEWANLCSLEKSIARLGYTTFVLALAGGLGYAVFVAKLIAIEQLLLVGGVWWSIALLLVQTYPASAVLWSPKVLRMMMGILVLLPTLVALHALRVMPSGHFLVLGLVLTVAAADIGAYFAGRAFGHRKLAPSVSPGKTWAGVVGGLVLVTIIALIYAILTHAAVLPTLVIAWPAALASVLGDLFESMLKRHRGIKDSSNLLPGHGGVLDRIDGLVAAAPVFALAVVVTGWQI
jgi:phosphatidate cytidylyltransferase